MKQIINAFIWFVVVILSNLGLGSEENNVTLQSVSKDVFAQVKNSIVMVKCKNSVGSGFVLAMEEGRKYFVTNNHVFDGDETIVARLLNGQKLKLGALEIASDRDLVRFRVDADCNALDILKDEPNVGEDVFVYGNSDGGDVATDLVGKIVGVGPEKIEVSAQFVHGNSGSAVLNSRGKVIGVATYATIDANPDDWTKANTRFVEPRRYALRLKNVSWKGVDFLAYCKKLREDRQREENEKKLVPEIDVSFSSPKIDLLIDAQTHYRDYHEGKLAAYVALNVKTDKDQFKSPVVRVCCLLKDLTSGENLFVDLIFDEVGKGWRCCPPIWAYGDGDNGWSYSIGNNRYVYFLEGLSYWRRPITKNAKNRRLIYCSDGKNRKPGDLIEIYNMDAKKIKVLCYRYECWQNGVLACVYDSKSESHLKNIGIPLDWYKKQKNMNEFNMKICPKPRSSFWD